MLLRNSLPREVVIQCRTRAARVELSSVNAEARRWNIVDETAALICDRLRPRTIDELLPASRGWYRRLLEHVTQANPHRLLVMWGRVGCGKTCLIDLVRELGGVPTQLFTDAALADTGAEDTLWDSVAQAASRARRDKRKSLVVVDNADTLKQAKLASEAFHRIADANRPVALVAIVNNWYARAGFITALRAHADARPSRLVIVPKNANGTPAGKRARKMFEGLEVVLFKCEPMHTAEDVTKHLKRCVPGADEALAAAIAYEADGDVRAAMQRLDMVARVSSKAAKPATMAEIGVRDRFASNSPVYQLRDAVDEMRMLSLRLSELPSRKLALQAAADAVLPKAKADAAATILKRAALVDSYSVVERRFSTLDTARTAEELLFANYPRFLAAELGVSMSQIDELVSIAKPEDKRKELHRMKMELDAVCELTERLSYADVARTLEERSCYEGASTQITLATGVGVVVRRIASTPSMRAFGTTTLKMDFGRAQAHARSVTNAGMLATLDPLLRLCEQLEGDERIRTLGALKETQLRLPSSALAPPIDRLERVVGIGRYQSRDTLRNYARLRREATERSSTALLGRLKAKGRPSMIEAYQCELRALGVDRRALARHESLVLDTANGVRTAALRAGALGLLERDFVPAVLFAESLRLCIDRPKEYKLLTKDEIGREYRAARQAKQSVVGKRHRVDVESVTLKRGKRQFAEPKREEKAQTKSDEKSEKAAPASADADEDEEDADEDDVLESGI